MLLKIAQKFNEQASTGTFVPGFMATYCHAKPLLAVPKAQKALPIIKTSEKERPLKSIRDSGGDKQLLYSRKIWWGIKFGGLSV